MKPKNLNKLRKEIDKIDAELISMINKRGAISCEIGRIKKSKNQPVYSPDRESQVYAGVQKKSKGPMGTGSLKAVYREIMSGCLALEHPMKIAFLGPELTFTHQAALKKFGSSLDYLS